MKIYDAKATINQHEEQEIVEKLLNNKLSLGEKIEQLVNSYDELRLKTGAMDLLITRLCAAFNGETRFARKGDNNERFDAVITFPTYYGVAEIEIPSTEILDAPRNLLDDYAVLKQRKTTYINKPIVPIVICWDLPNHRTDYWNVITDIDKIVEIQIKTISIFALAILYWTDTNLDLLGDDFFLRYGHEEMTSMKKILQMQHIPAHLSLGYIEPYK